MNQTKYKIGFTQGTFDMFHIGHLNILNSAKKQCEYLIVGVNSDELVKEYKKKIPVICESERLEIIRNIKAVDEVVLTGTLDKVEAWNNCHFNAIFIGDDWKGKFDFLAEEGVEVVYLPRTPEISTTQIKNDLENKIL